MASNSKKPFNVESEMREIRYIRLFLLVACVPSLAVAAPKRYCTDDDVTEFVTTSQKFRKSTVVCYQNAKGKLIPGTSKEVNGQICWQNLSGRLRKKLKKANLGTEALKIRYKRAFGRYKTACKKANPEGSPSTPVPTATVPPSTEGHLLVDHRATMAFDDIPEYWLTKAKELTVHYAHTSHGSQIVSGLNYLEQYVDAEMYSFARRTTGSSAGLPPIESPAALRMYDGNPPETYITPEDYWASASGIDRTEDVVNSGEYSFSLWSWCGQQSSNSEATVNRYLSVMHDFENQYPNMRFILMTGHTDGGSARLTYNNNLVRQYAASNGKVLFDFADIESYDPDGNYYPETDDECSWCSDWCSQHRQQCQNLPSCAHSHGINCVQKGKAFWWMMAKLAGWPR